MFSKPVNFMLYIVCVSYLCTVTPIYCNMKCFIVKRCLYRHLPRQYECRRVLEFRTILLVLLFKRRVEKSSDSAVCLYIRSLSIYNISYLRTCWIVCLFMENWILYDNIYDSFLSQYKMNVYKFKLIHRQLTTLV